jgi:hypothetical protein
LNKAAENVLSSYNSVKSNFVVAWDSHLASADEYVRLCRAAKHLGKTLEMPWSCSDTNHPGLAVTVNAAQTLLAWMDSTA